jgi:hypothetical protein
MKCLKEKETGNLVRTTNEKAAEMVESGLFVYSTKGRFKSVLKQKKKLEKKAHLLAKRRLSFGKIGENWRK